jgi:hypothetical protein
MVTSPGRSLHDHRFIFRSLIKFEASNSQSAKMHIYRILTIENYTYKKRVEAIRPILYFYSKKYVFERGGRIRPGS